MPSGKLDNPACKLHLEDIASIRNEGGKWVYCDSELRFETNLLWLQGTISSISNNTDEIGLREGENTISVCNCKSIPGGTQWIQVGQYVMVFGEIQIIRPINPVIRAIKISNLSHSPLFEKMWQYNVREAKLINSNLEEKMA